MISHGSKCKHHLDLFQEPPSKYNIFFLDSPSSGFPTGKTKPMRLTQEHRFRPSVPARWLGLAGLGFAASSLPMPSWGRKHRRICHVFLLGLVVLCWCIHLLLVFSDIFEKKTNDFKYVRGSTQFWHRNMWFCFILVLHKGLGFVNLIQVISGWQVWLASLLTAVNSQWKLDKPLGYKNHHQTHSRVLPKTIPSAPWRRERERERPRVTPNL